MTKFIVIFVAISIYGCWRLCRASAVADATWEELNSRGAEE